MSQAKHKHVVETIADVDLWEAIVDAVNTISAAQEAAFEFGEDGLTIRVKDPANVAMVAQEVAADGFDHYDVVNERTVVGVDTVKLADLIDVADGDDPIRFHLNGETRKFEFEVEGNGVEYDLAGIDHDTIQGSPVDVPPIKDKHDYSIRCDVPVSKWATGIEVVDLTGSGHGTFVYDDEEGAFSLEGHADTDTSRVDLTEDDRFAWHDDGPPDGDELVEVVMSNEYMTDIIDVLEDGDDDVVRFVTGTELPYHVWQTHADGRVETKVLQAPRIVN